MKRVVTGAALAALLAGVAVAQDAPLPPGGPDAPPPMRHGPPTRDQVAQMVQRMFARADANHDGVVTRAEYDQARQEMETRRREHHDRAFARLDANKNGSLSRSEFDSPPQVGKDANGAPPPPLEGPGGRVRRGGHGLMGPGMMGPAWFDRADADHDGKVTLAEAQAAALARFDAMDRNRDGTLRPDEMGAPPPAGPDGAPPPPR